MKLISPTLLLDKDKCLANLDAMVKKAKQANVRLRPHCKTHQSKTLAEWYRKAGVKQITVSSVAMAKYFAENDWDDITIAFPLNICEMEILNNFNPQININLLISSVETANSLSLTAKRAFGCYLKIDTGYHRCGLTYLHIDEISHITEVLNKSPRLKIKGLLAHFGNTYQSRNADTVKNIYQEGVRQLFSIKEHFSAIFPMLEISVGDTPSCSLLDDFMNVTEIRPGNFIFYDMMQVQIGSCTTDQIAVGLACPVVECHPERNEVIIHGGAIHLSKEYIIDSQGNRNYGSICLLENNKWSPPLPGCYLKALSQEHGIIHLPDQFAHTIKIASWIIVLPVHSCLTVDAMKTYTTFDGEIIPTFSSTF